SPAEQVPSGFAPPPIGAIEIVTESGLVPEIDEIQVIADDTDVNDSSLPHSASRTQADQEDER
ncbi:MAG: hypothetical protein KDA91_26255, partial [Planctomycetaceae bacterium]|nr:hypothetical protein [Planctomycetaceae bacterium]